MSRDATSDVAPAPINSQAGDDAPTSTTPTYEYHAPRPSFRLLFSLVSRRDQIFLILPAIVLSVIAGGIAPFMTFLIGQIFNTFANFAVVVDPSESDKDAMLSGISKSVLELVGLGAAAFALSSVTSWFWISVGERNTMRIRKKVYASVAGREMAWYDTKIGTEDSVQKAEGEGPVGAGGLMAKFTKDMDDIRMASSLACGMVLQFLTTCVACLILGFVRSWSLTLLILTAVPVMTATQIVTQIMAGPLIGVERARIATAATIVDRAVSAIATVKAFNAEEQELATFGAIAEKLRRAAWDLNRTWAFTSGFTQFTIMAMFVQGFWFGAKLVRSGDATPGDVMTVFWACLIATTNLQMCIPHLLTLTKGKAAMSSLVALAEAPAPGTNRAHRTLPRRRKNSAQLRGIRPTKCDGHLALDDVYFAYPSRPDVPVLRDVSMFLPAKETTFIVGESGSGKSTIAQLLLRMYAPGSGTISLDEQDVEFLDTEFTRAHIGAVSQGAILFDMTVHENVAMGLAAPGSTRKPEQATRAEVVAACQVALMQRFVQDLPLEYDTPLGNGGANLSGGQKQRLAIARAMLRDPTILILDEATSALDATSRVLVFEAIKHWRKNKTTIVITHDLSQIDPTDFVYVLKDGEVVEQGYRADLEQDTGEFRKMAGVQGMGATAASSSGDVADAQLDPWSEEAERVRAERVESIMEADNERSAAAMPMRPMSVGNWMLDALHDLTGFEAVPNAVTQGRSPQQVSRFAGDAATVASSPRGHGRRPSTLAIDIPSPTAAHTTENFRYSLQFSPTSPPAYDSHGFTSTTTLLGEKHSADSKEDTRFPAVQRRVRRRDMAKLTPLKQGQVDIIVDAKPQEGKQESFWQLVKEVYPTVPYKWLVCLGLLFSVISGAITPIFSFLLSRLFFEVSVGAKNVQLINTFGSIVLAMAIADGLFMGLKYFVLETAAMHWVTRLRNITYRLILKQDKKWFDKSENSGARLVQILIKDGDDARSLIAIVLGHAVVVTSMLGVGLIWALVWGWQLTLVGFAIAPVFGAVMVIQTNLVTKFETRNKRAREDVAQGYYDTILNIRGIRAMGFESVFRQRFDKSVDAALRTGIRGAFVEGCTYGVASSLIYMSEALLFYVGARLVVNGTYTYLQFVQVLNLVVFSVSIGSQLMAFTQRIAKSVAATRDWNRILKLSDETDESRGVIKPSLEGDVAFRNISFAYPERPDVPVLRNVSLTIRDGESVAIVGSSGSGKSTVAALLQRLYEPAPGGLITMGQWDTRYVDVHHLREHVSVVSQSPNLFDATIAENIAYGATGLTREDIESAARKAQVHDFIMELPLGYDTMVGENAALISGGQAQRLQIARALARPAQLLILDECTSALDGANQAAVLDAVLGARAGRSTLMVTHKLPAMRMCDRIIVLDGGAVAEEGSYDELIARKGVFAQLARGGEWSA